MTSKTSYFLAGEALKGNETAGRLSVSEGLTEIRRWASGPGGPFQSKVYMQKTLRSFLEFDVRRSVSSFCYCSCLRRTRQNPNASDAYNSLPNPLENNKISTSMQLLFSRFGQCFACLPTELEQAEATVLKFSELSLPPGLGFRAFRASVCINVSVAPESAPGPQRCCRSPRGSPGRWAPQHGQC